MEKLKNMKTAIGTDMFGGSAALGRIHGLLDRYISPLSYASLLFKEPIGYLFNEPVMKGTDKEQSHDEPAGVARQHLVVSGQEITYTFVDTISVNGVIHTIYGGGKNWDFFSENAPTLIAAIEVALNPPLPPKFVLDAEKLAWSHIYPPLRYSLCLMAVRKVGKLLLTSATTRDHVKEYMQKMADAAGIPLYEPDNMGVGTDPFAICIDDFVQDQQNEELTTRLYTEFDHFDFTLSCQRMFNELQTSRKNGMIIDLMLACFRGELPHYGRPPEIANKHLQRCLEPPVIIDTSNKKVRVGSGLWPEEMAIWLVLKASKEYALLDLISSKGEIAFETKLMRAEQDSINTWLMAIFGMLPW